MRDARGRYCIPPLFKTEPYWADGDTIPWKHRHPLRDLVHGVWFGYPPCCVLRFSWDSIWGRLSGNLRGGRLTDDGRPYVPCGILHSARS